MSLNLPTYGFEWVAYKFNNSDESAYLDSQSIQYLMGDNEGYFAELDLNYSKGLHDMHNDFPLAPESMISKQWSEYMREVNGDKILKHSKVPKLVPNLHDRKNM